MSHNKVSTADPTRRLILLMQDPEPIPDPIPELTPEQKKEAIRAYLNSEEGKIEIQKKVDELASGIDNRERRWQRERAHTQEDVRNLRRIRRPETTSDPLFLEDDDVDPSLSIDTYLTDL